MPNATIVLVRTSGVWGSMYSFAPTGKHPDLTKLMFAGLGLLFANLLFFAPRRRVDITAEKLDRSQLPELQREKINPWFESWYNAAGPAQPVFVPYHFLFGPRTFEFPPARRLPGNRSQQGEARDQGSRCRSDLGEAAIGRSLPRNSGRTPRWTNSVSIASTAWI